MPDVVLNSKIKRVTLNCVFRFNEAEGIVLTLVNLRGVFVEARGGS